MSANLIIFLNQSCFLNFFIKKHVFHSSKKYFPIFFLFPKFITEAGIFSWMSFKSCNVCKLFNIFDSIMFWSHEKWKHFWNFHELFDEGSEVLFVNIFDKTCGYQVKFCLDQVSKYLWNKICKSISNFLSKVVVVFFIHSI